jgi:hypothetical protein
MRIRASKRNLIGRRAALGGLGPFAALFAALVLAGIASGGQAYRSTAPRADADAVQTASTPFRGGDRVKTVPIARGAWQKPRSIMSLSPKDIGTLTPGRRIEAAAEAEVTICAQATPGNPGTPCVGRTYGYDPYLKMKVVLGPAGGSTGGSNTVDLTGTESITCSQHQPNRNRHCVLSIPWGGMTVPADAASLPCAPSSCHMNLVLSADRSTARDGDVVVVGSSDDNRRISQGRGRLSSVLFSGSDRPLRSWQRSKPYHQKLKVWPDDSDGHPQVAYSLPLKGLDKGDQIVVDAKSVTGIGSLPYNITERSGLIFAKKPGSVKPSGSILETNPRISGENGFGCTQGPSAHQGPCTVGKSGVISIKKSSKKTWFINLVLSQEASDVAPKASRWRPSDRISVSGAGVIRARAYTGSSSCATCSIGGGSSFAFSPDEQPGSKIFKRLVNDIQAFGITQGRYACQRRNSGPSKLVCDWHSEGTFGDSRKYVCDSKAFLSHNNKWNVKVCKDALGAQLWHLLQEQVQISPTYAGACKENGKKSYKCKWFAKGERASGKYFCRGYADYSAKSHHWDIDPCKNQRQ